MINKQQRKVRITDNGTKTPANVSCYLHQIVLACANAGTAWTIKIQDKATSPAIVIQGTLGLSSDGWPVKDHFDEPIYMENGIDIITAGTTPGVVTVWLSYGKQDA